MEIAAKLDLSDMDNNNLHFYSYDKAANNYRTIAQPKYWVDLNGYLHFWTLYANDIVISEGPISK